MCLKEKKKKERKQARACWPLVSVARSLCPGRDGVGLTHLVGTGKVWRCTFRWREQTAAFLFCQLSFWRGDASPVAVAGGQVWRGGQLNALQVCGTSSWSSSLLLWILSSCRGSYWSGERLNGQGRRQQPVLARPLASLTVFTQSSQQLFSSSAHCNALLWRAPPCMVRFCFRFMFYCSVFSPTWFPECWEPPVDPFIFPFLFNILLASNQCVGIITESAICFNIF